MSIMFLDAVPQGLIQKVGIKTAQKRSFKILQGISGTIKPVRLCKCRQQVLPITTMVFYAHFVLCPTSAVCASPLCITSLLMHTSGHTPFNLAN